MSDQTLYLIQSDYAATVSVLDQLAQLHASDDQVVLMGESVLYLDHAFVQQLPQVYILKNDAEILTSPLSENVALLEVLQAVRQFYQQFGHSPATRPLIKFLMKTVSPEINNALLQEKFNTGLVARHLSRLAGIPKPANCL